MFYFYIIYSLILFVRRNVPYNVHFTATSYCHRGHSKCATLQCLKMSAGLTTELPPETDSLFSATVSAADSATHLTVGAPGPSLLAALPPLFQEAATHFLGEQATNPHMFQYGPELGTATFRQELAAFLSRRYGDPVAADQLVLTTGATNGLHLVTSRLVRPGGVVFVENPTYFIALNLLSGDMGLEVVPVDMLRDGVDIAALERSVERAAAGRSVETEAERHWGAIYTIPTFHNPTGVTLGRQRGEQLIAVARRWNLLVVCDDVYNLLSYSPLAVSRLKTLDTAPGGLVISNGSFSKILAPGVRLGWLEAPPRLVAALASSGVLLSGGSQNNVMSGLVTSLLSLGHLDTLLDTAIATYSQRMEAAVSILQSGLPASWSVLNPRGGYFLWIETDIEDLKSFVSWLRTKKKILVMHGSHASPNTHLEKREENCCMNSFRVSIAYYDLPKLEYACNDLCSAAKEYFV